MFSEQKHPNLTSYLDRLLTRPYVFVYVLVLQILVNYRFNCLITDPKVLEPFYRYAFLPFFWAFVIHGLLCLIENKDKFRKVSYWVYALATIFYLIEGFLLDTYSSVFTPSVATAILATNPEETKEFWSASISLGSYLPSFLGLILAVGLAFVAYLIPQLLLKLWERLKGFFRLLMPMAMLPVLAVGLFYFYPKMFYIYSKAFDGGIAFTTLTPPERFFWSTEQVVSNMRGAEAYMAKVSENNTKIEGVAIKDSLPPHRFVLIIGESMRPDYMHCYGYDLENTPHIDSLARRGDLQLFSDAVSPSHSTGGSIPQFMSAKTADNPKKWYQTPCLPVIMRSADYQSFWLSKQEKLSAFLQSVFAIANLSDSTYYISKSGKDDAVLPHLEKYLTQTKKLNKNAFDVIHIMGSHVAYHNRYTEAYNKFKPADIQDDKLNDSQKFNVSAYANSIFFNDYVVGEIIKRYEQEPAIVMYLSDHGQAIYDDPNNPNLAGHSLSLGGVSIPMMVYVSPILQKEAPQLMEKLKRAKDRPFMSDVLPFSIMGLLNIEAPFYEARYDVFSEDYDLSRKRIARWDSRTIEVKHSSVNMKKMPIY